MMEWVKGLTKFLRVVEITLSIDESLLGVGSWVYILCLMNYIFDAHDFCNIVQLKALSLIYY